MARLVGTTALDMTRWDNLYNDSSGADIGEHDENHFVATSDVHTFSVKGAGFEYDEIDDDIFPTDGTVHSFRAGIGSQADFRITGMAEDATTIAQYLATEDWDAFASDVFSGKDRIEGSIHDDHIRGFFGADRMFGGNGADLISGDAGADKLTGGAGADRFDYNEADDSTSVFFDAITDFHTANDTISVTVGVTGIDPTIAGGTLRKAHFDSDLVQAVGSGELGLHHAVLFNVTDGYYDGHTFLVVNWNGQAGYQAGADLVIDVTGISGTLDTDNFITL